MKMLDLFAGIGGFSYAAHKLVGGFTTTQFVEIDPYCQSVLRKNFPNIPIHDDIKTFTGKPGQFQVITAGFPCQDLSVAGKQRGIGEGTRSGLFYEIIRLLGEIQPEFVLFENVRNLLSHEGGTTFQEVLFQIAKAGYDAEWSIISAKDMGACHLRQRLWILAYKTGKYGNRTERITTDSYNDGLSSSSINEVDDKANSSSQERQNQVSESSGSSKSSDSRIIQSSTELANSNSEGLQREILREMESGIWSAKHTRRLDPNWRSYVSKPILPRGSYGLSNRVDRTKALGNSIVPAVAAIPLQRVHDLYYK